MRCRFEVFFNGFRQIPAYIGHWVYFGLSSNRRNGPVVVNDFVVVGFPVADTMSDQLLLVDRLSGP